MNINSKKLAKVAETFTNLMIEKITEVSNDWQKPWLTIKRKDYLPRNISGRHYSGGNTFMLLIQSINYDYATPIFLTFLQASKMNIHIKKGSTSFPVYHIAYMYYSPNAKERISIEKYEKLDESEQKNYYMIQTPKCYNIFNLDQTDYKDKYPEEWSEMLMRHQEIPVGIDTVNSYSNDMLDEVITQQSWICPILEEYSNKAYYSPSQDIIKLPQKNQFHRGKSYYATALHEMIHSTGSKDRLNRIKTFRSDAEYAKEGRIFG